MRHVSRKISPHSAFGSTHVSSRDRSSAPAAPAPPPASPPRAGLSVAAIAHRPGPAPAPPRPPPRPAPAPPPALSARNGDGSLAASTARYTARFDGRSMELMSSVLVLGPKLVLARKYRYFPPASNAGEIASASPSVS